MQTLLRWLLCLLLIASGVGCTSVQECGDARVQRTGHTLTQIEVEGYLAIFPAVALDQAGTTEFKVIHLPAGTYAYDFYLRGGSLYEGADRQATRPPPSASHAPARVAFEILSPEGHTLFAREARLGELKLSRDGSSMYPDLPRSTSTATDYRLRVHVLTPSRAASEKLFIRAFAPSE